MTRTVIQTEEKNTSEILIEKGIFSKIEERADFVFTDSNVLALYREKIAKKFQGVPVYAMPAGEENKTQVTLFHLLDEMKKAELTRGATLVCIGGGVVGDVGGLAAALYMRGITCVQVPTTLLSQVDSSVGGKTAIDFGGVKNLVGAFFQPKKVYIDGEFLFSLPRREIKCGLGEIIKHGALNKELFKVLYQNRFRLFDLEFLGEIIAQNVAIKADIVGRDAQEKGLRRCLNLAHTTAHALELSDGQLSHGEYVLIGILFEAEIAKRKIANADGEYLDRLSELARLALETIPAFPPLEEAARCARLDKKNQASEKIFLTVPVGCGSYAFLELAFQEYVALLKEVGDKIC